MLHRLATDRINPFSSFSFSISDILSLKYVIEVEYEAAMNTYGGEHREAVNLLVSALRVYKSGMILYNMTITRPKFWQPYGGLVTLGNIESKLLFGTTYKITAQEVNGLKEFWSRFKSFNFINNKSLEIAIKRFNYAYERPKSEDKLIDFFVSLEAMFLTGSERTELSYRLSIRIAKFLGDSPTMKNEIFSDIRKAYDVRSEIVHGSSKIKPEKLVEIEPKIEQYTRLAIIKFVNLLPSKTHEFIMDEIDKNIFT